MKNQVICFVKSNRKMIFLVLAAIIAIGLILPSDFYWARDRLNYTRYITEGKKYIEYFWKRGFLSYLSNEPLYYLISLGIGSFLGSESTVKTIIVLSTFFYFIGIGKLSKFSFWNLILFFAVPLILINYTTHLRQGLAMSLYFIGLAGLKEKKWYQYIRFLTPFIHSSFIFLIACELAEYFLSKFIKNKRTRLTIVAIGFGFFMVGMPALLELFGDRRLHFYAFEFSIAGSGLGFIAWLIMGGIYIWFGKDDYISMLSFYGIIFYLVSYFYLDFGARVLEGFLPLIVVSFLNDERPWFKHVMLFMLIGFGFLSWISTGGTNL